MNNLRDSISKCSISNTESKNLYVKLRNKLIDHVKKIIMSLKIHIIVQMKNMQKNMDMDL